MTADETPPAAKPTSDSGLSLGLRGSLLGVGLLQCGLAVAVIVSGRIGTIPLKAVGGLIGVTFVLPALIAGVFAIAREFRTRRVLALVAISVWSIASIGHLARLARGDAVRQISAAEMQRILQKHRIPRAEITTDASTATTPEAPPEAAAGTPATIEPGPPPDPSIDFSPGSDARLVDLVEGVRQERYVELVTAYEQACRHRPDDPVLALERVKFIEHFLWSESHTIDRAATDHEQALAELTGRFPHEPGTALHLLRNVYDPEFKSLDIRHSVRIDRWSPADRAALFLQRARAAQANDDATRALSWARRSLDTLPTADAALMVAQGLKDRGDTSGALRALAKPEFEGAEPWLRKQRMDLLLDLGEDDLALEVFAQLPAGHFHDARTALRLARAGEVEHARTILEGLPRTGWNADEVARGRFAFELEFGDADRSLAAYRELRDQVGPLEPFSRDRFALLLAHPSLDWSADDLAQLLLLALLLAFVATLPGLVLLPIHYQSLRKGRSHDWPGVRWGLRTTWWAGALFLVGATLGTWAFSPGSLILFSESAALPEDPSEVALLPSMTVQWVAMAAILAVLFARDGAWRSLGPGGWSAGKAFACAAGLALLLRFAYRTVVVVWPEAFTAGFLGSVSDQIAIARELREYGGPLLLLAVFALAVPLLEEAAFRGLLLPAFAHHVSFRAANVIQAGLFALAHMSAAHFLFHFAFGLAAGLLHRRSGGLAAPILLHVVNNLLGLAGILAILRLGD